MLWLATASHRSLAGCMVAPARPCLQRHGSRWCKTWQKPGIGLARDLLTNSRMTIAEVAHALGYADARSFRRAFKRWTGLLPTALRETAAN